MVITACPGSGKTTVIAEKIRKEILSLYNFQGVIGITFTLKASEELKQRCSKDAFDIKSSFFGTIDHFCLSEVIFPFANRVFGFSDMDIKCKKYDEIEDCYKEFLPNLNDKNTVLCTSDYAKYHSEFLNHYQQGFILLEAVGVIANNIITNSRACRRYIKARYTSIYIDEYQDSSEPQHQTFLTLLNLGLKATAVGDVQQSIYAWRGTSSEYINSLVAQQDIFEHHIVNINHRCHPSITNYANRLFSSKCELLYSDDIRVYRRCFEGSQLDLATQLNTYIPKVAENFGIANLSDIAVLVRYKRSLNYLVSNITIPCRVYKDDSLSSINSKHTKIYSELLKYYCDPNFLINDISELIKNESSLGKYDLAVVRSDIKELRNKDINVLSLEIQRISLSIIGSSGTEREACALDYVISSPEELKQYAPKNINEVQIMTLHKSKGLEFEIVFHLDLYDWIFPFRKYIEGYGEPSYPEWEQDLNLHYVGITRAKSACILVHSRRRLNAANENKSSQPSQFFSLDGLEGLYR